MAWGGVDAAGCGGGVTGGERARARTIVGRRGVLVGAAWRAASGASAMCNLAGAARVADWQHE